MREQLTEQQVADLIWSTKYFIDSAEAGLNEASDMDVLMAKVALASLEAEPRAWFTDDAETDKSSTTYSKQIAECWRDKEWPVNPLYTAPPVPVLRLPGEPTMVEFYENVSGGNRSEPDEAGFEMWKAAIAEVQRLNAGAQVVTLPAVEKWRSVDQVRAQNAYRVLVEQAIRAAGGEVAE